MTKKILSKMEVENISRDIAKKEIDNNPLLNTLISQFNNMKKTVDSLDNKLWIIIAAVVGDGIIRMFFK